MNRPENYSRGGGAWPQEMLEKLYDYEVFDREDQKIGSVSAVWVDQSNQPSFIGVNTSWLGGKAHVIPAHGWQRNDQREILRVPYAERDVKDAPSYDPEDEINADQETEILAYYRTKGSFIPETEPAHATRGATRPERSGQTGQEATIPLSEEEVRIGKRQVEDGGVRIRKVVRGEQVERPVELRHEEIQLERVPAGDDRARAGEAFHDEDVFIPLRREEPVVEKEAHVREEVRAHKTSGTEHRTISENVRKEDVEIDEDARKRPGRS